MENKANKENQKIEKFMDKKAEEFQNSVNDEFYNSVNKIRITINNLASIGKKIIRGTFEKKKLIDTMNEFYTQYQAMYNIAKSLVEK